MHDSDPRRGSLAESRVLVVDDHEANLSLMRAILERVGIGEVLEAVDPTAVPELLAEGPLPDLVILDLHMPGMDGFELMERLAPQTGAGRLVPFLVVTADTTTETRNRALALGARDFLTKPVEPTEVMLRVQNLLDVRRLQRELDRRNRDLEMQVLDRTRELESTRLEILDRLGVAAEYRDDQTQQHARRIGRTSAVLARELGLSETDAALIRRAAPLHDIGKIGVSDAILLKPGKLTPEEFETMKLHTTIGAAILAASRSPVLQLAETVARSHHERWDGSGYPDRLAGDEIPLVGRIVAVADVFDALAHERPYKTAWPPADAATEIEAQRGRQFDPTLVDAFGHLDHERLIAGLEAWDVEYGSAMREERTSLV